MVAAVVVLLGPEPKHCSQEEGPEPPAEGRVRFQRPKRGRPPAGEELAAVEGTFAAAVAGAAIVRKDCLVGWTPPTLPYPGPRDLRRKGPQRVRQEGHHRDFRKPEEHHMDRLRPAWAPEGHRRGLVFGSAERRVA